MLNKTLLSALLASFIGFSSYSQCSSEISAPAVAISNCSGTGVTATASGPGPYQYSWYSSTATFSASNVSNPDVLTTTPGWHVINVVIVDANMCTSVATDSIEFIAPVTTFNSTYCDLPDSICILDIPMQVQGWTYTDNLGNETSLPLTDCVQIIGPGDYELFGIYEPNCTVLHTYHVVEDCSSNCTSEISAPSVAISNCSGAQVTATASGPGPYQYSWYSSTASFTSSTSPNPLVSATTSGWHVINVVIVDANMCTSVATDSIEFIAPVTTFNSTYCDLPDSICILDIPMQVQGWTYTDNLGNETNLPLTDCLQIIGPGDYELFGIYEPNCTVLHTYHVEQDCSNLGIEEHVNSTYELIYPNPVNDLMNVKLNSKDCKNWEILDVSGNKLISQSIESEVFEIDLSTLSSGYYMIRFVYEGSISTAKFIKK